MKASLRQPLPFLLGGAAAVLLHAVFGTSKAVAVTTVTTYTIETSAFIPVVSATGLEFGPGQGIVAHGFVDYSLLPGFPDDAALAAQNPNLTVQNITDVFSAFRIFGTGGSGTPAISTFATAEAFGLTSAFSVTGSATLTYANPFGAPFINKNIYTIAGNGTTFGSSTEIFLFKSIGSLPDQPSIYALENPLPGTSDVAISLQFAANPMEGEILLGGYGIFQSDFGGASPVSLDAFSLQGPAVIPEPSRALFLVGGTAASLLLRRRKTDSWCPGTFKTSIF